MYVVFEEGCLALVAASRAGSKREIPLARITRGCNMCPLDGGKPRRAEPSERLRPRSPHSTGPAPPPARPLPPSRGGPAAPAGRRSPCEGSPWPGGEEEKGGGRRPTRWRRRGGSCRSGASGARAGARRRPLAGGRPWAAARGRPRGAPERPRPEPRSPPPSTRRPPRAEPGPGAGPAPCRTPGGG